MKIAFFSPMPPARSGIADYSQALVDELAQLTQLTVFDRATPRFDPQQFDHVIYQIGNNADHAFVYQEALRSPGTVVLHEANLHHLIAEMTIKAGDWDAYLQAVEYDAGPAALAYAQRVRALECGPDYEGVPMLRRLLERSRALIVHSHWVAEQVRKAGFQGPLAVVPHGAWVPSVDRMAWRERLGVRPETPLIGIFGFLKPYKRIAESLRAFRRLLRVNPQVRLILAGEAHPDLHLDQLLRGLEAQVRPLGYVTPEEFTGSMAACDIVLNLRYPTVGETSGTLMRALGLGKAVIVSEVGAFAELPDDICLKAPVGPDEEDVLFEFLDLLVSRPALRRRLGEAARAWVERECSWTQTARRYLAFLETGEATAAPSSPPPAGAQVAIDYIKGWARDEEARRYIATHETRLTRTLEITPRGTAQDRVLEMGAYLQLTPALKTRLGYGEVRGCYYGPKGRVDRYSLLSDSGERFECEVDLFDAERDVFPYPDEYFATVLCCELIEHLERDPMHMMAEINRILRLGGHLVLTTPNIVSARAIAAILQGFHPGFFPAYLRPAEGAPSDARHSREYAPREIRNLLQDAGFEVVRLETGEFREHPQPELLWVRDLLERYGLDTELRGDGIYAVGVKHGPVRRRYPDWLYD
jgi:glycosyltransferase involved in cell wall biosynthesis/SAM-dependent methyltransferase